MTAHKHFKQRIRARMEKTGERYAAARRYVLTTIDGDTLPSPVHFPGTVPATTAMRVLLTRAGVRAPHTGRPFSEAMLFGIAGGIGIGVASFVYQTADVATLYLAGRHLWWDDAAYLRAGLERFGIAPAILETGSSRLADENLRAMLDQYGACIAWVDLAELPHRAMPAEWSGGGYHVITVYTIDDTTHTAMIGDLTDEPCSITLGELAKARARIRKQRHRLLAVPPVATIPELPALVRAGLSACRAELAHPSLPAPAMGRLDALRVWAERMDGATGADSWARAFRPGRQLLRGLSAMYDFIEHFGTGGGLSRHLFATFLHEAAELLGHTSLGDAAGRYAELGAEWSALAEAALPDDVPLLAEVKQLYARKAELLHAGAAASEVRAVWERLAELEALAGEHFPLADAACAELRAGLKRRILALYAGELSALATLDGVPE